jgi:acyl-CoA synthetase (AMP-forming)/AMP-acid ligase II
MNAVAFLAEIAAAAPDRPALISLAPARSISFAELDTFTARLSTELSRAGIKRGDRAALLAPVSINFYACLLALARLGAAAVILEPKAGLTAFNRAAVLAGPQAIIGSRGGLWLRWLSPALRSIRLRLELPEHSPQMLSRPAGQPWLANFEDAPDVLALMAFTAGDLPRAVAYTHRILAAQHDALARVLPGRAGDKDLPGSPLDVLHNLASGIPSVLPGFLFLRRMPLVLETALANLGRQGITTASGPPAYWRPIAEYCLANGRSLALRRIAVVGAPASSRLVELLRQASPRAEIVCVYGRLEAGPIAVLDAAELAGKTAALTARGAGLALGQPAPGVQVRIRDGAGQDQAADAPGEIWVAGPHIAGTVADAPREAGWHRLGDAGYRDRIGRLWLLGRSTALIARSGEILYPVPVEAAVETLPFVRRAAFVGVPDPKLGQRAALVVELEPRQPDDWQLQLRALCDRYAWPVDEVWAVPRLPVSTRDEGQVDYARLKRDLSKKGQE